MSPERLRGILFSKSSLITTLSKPETNGERIKLLERDQRDGNGLLLCSLSVSGEGPKIIRKKKITFSLLFSVFD